MRDDMSEVIIERPRRGSRMGHVRRARRMDAKLLTKHDPDRLLARVGLERGAWFGHGVKSLNENLAPLRRYLERQVNRPWDKIWSEISANLRATNTVQQHVRDHVTDFVAVNTFMKDGAVWVTTRYGKPIPLSDGTLKLYVDPRSGLLRINKRYKTWQRARRETAAAAERHRATRMREIAANIQAHKLDDNCWWEIRLAAIPTRQRSYFNSTQTYTVEAPYTDVVHAAKLSRLPVNELYGRVGVYAAAKRQLSRNEIRDLDLPR